MHLTCDHQEHLRRPRSLRSDATSAMFEISLLPEAVSTVERLTQSSQ